MENGNLFSDTSSIKHDPVITDGELKTELNTQQIIVNENKTDLLHGKDLDDENRTFTYSELFFPQFFKRDSVSNKDDINTSLQTIEQNSNNLLNLVNQMLDLTKLEQGSLSINMIQNEDNSVSNISTKM